MTFKEFKKSVQMQDTTNLYNEITLELEYAGKTWNDVLFIYTEKPDPDGKYLKSVPYEIDKETFIEEAKQIDYYPGPDKPEINTDLKVVGGNWWLERFEKEGGEFWAFQEKPEKPNRKIGGVKSKLRDEELGIRYKLYGVHDNY